MECSGENTCPYRVSAVFSAGQWGRNDKTGKMPPNVLSPLCTQPALCSPGDENLDTAVREAARQKLLAPGYAVPKALSSKPQHFQVRTFRLKAHMVGLTPSRFPGFPRLSSRLCVTEGGSSRSSETHPIPAPLGAALGNLWMWLKLETVPWGSRKHEGWAPAGPGARAEGLACPSGSSGQLTTQG